MVIKYHVDGSDAVSTRDLPIVMDPRAVLEADARPLCSNASNRAPWQRGWAASCNSASNFVWDKYGKEQGKFAVNCVPSFKHAINV